MTKRYTVETYDAFDAPSERLYLVVGHFDMAEEALACAMGGIDNFLRDKIAKGESASDAVRMFSSFGEVPMIFGEPKVDFNPFYYVKGRSITLAIEMGKLGKP